MKAPAKTSALKDLRRQYDRLDRARNQAVYKFIEQQEADALRQKIREMGEEPCA